MEGVEKPALDVGEARAENLNFNPDKRAEISWLEGEDNGVYDPDKGAEISWTEETDNGDNAYNPDKRADVSWPEGEVANELKEKYPEEEGYEIISEAYLRDKDGNVVKDPDTGEKSQNKDVSQETEQTEKKGGSYGELKKEGHGWNHEPREEVHHMPSDESSPLDRNDGPAIAMDYEDHRKTASCGNSREAQEYRAKQKELIDKGKFAEAMQMDIDDIRDKFGSKYDDAIAEMKEYAKSKGYI